MNGGRKARIGVYGGTFDPPHLAHRILAEEARFQLGLERVLWVLTQVPPHKRERSITSLDERLAMIAAAIDGDPGFELSRVDIDRPPPHYSVDSMHLLRQGYPQVELIYLMGSDSLHDLPDWHTPQRFIFACDGLGVMRRPGVEVDWQALGRELPGLQDKILWIDAPLLEISSTDIRRRVAEGRPYRYFVPQAVYEIIRAQKLYIQA